MSEVLRSPADGAVLPTQAPSSVVMVRPHRFRPNPLTIADNAFQSRAPQGSPESVARSAYDEVTLVAERLRSVGVDVHLFDDTGDQLPDSVFPNNWFSTHSDGGVALYPMYSPNRRGERRSDVVAMFRREFRVTAIHDYSVLEDDEVYLEGTGAMVLDHVHRAAYIARSHRAHDQAVSQVCRDLGYRPSVFATTDRRGVPIYHTNVMMSVGTSMALVGLETIADDGERYFVERQLQDSGHVVVPLTHTQIDNFAGNAIEVQGATDRFLVMSARACASLTDDQKLAITEHATILPVPVPTIELAGGSVRCMIAGIHLPEHGPRTASVLSAAQAGAVGVLVRQEVADRQLQQLAARADEEPVDPQDRRTFLAPQHLHDSVIGGHR